MNSRKRQRQPHTVTEARYRHLKVAMHICLGVEFLLFCTTGLLMGLHQSGSFLVQDILLNASLVNLLIVVILSVWLAVDTLGT
jgi:hypothetical protein